MKMGLSRQAIRRGRWRRGGTPPVLGEHRQGAGHSEDRRREHGPAQEARLSQAEGQDREGGPRLSGRDRPPLGIPRRMMSDTYLHRC